MPQLCLDYAACNSVTRHESMNREHIRGMGVPKEGSSDLLLRCRAAALQTILLCVIDCEVIFYSLGRNVQAILGCRDAEFYH